MATPPTLTPSFLKHSLSQELACSKYIQVMTQRREKKGAEKTKMELGVSQYKVID